MAVLLEVDLTGKPIVGCKTPVPPAPTKPCTTLVKVASGLSQKLMYGTPPVPVLLASLAGTTDGNPIGPLAVDSVQAKLSST